MKKLFSLFIFSLFIRFVFGQDITVKNGQNYKVYNGVAGDTLTSTTTAIDVNIFLQNEDFNDEWYKYDISVDIDSSGDGTDATVYLQGSYDNSTWTTITTTTWGMTTTDTTIRYENLSSDEVITTSGTYASASYIIAQDSAASQLNFADTVRVPAITVTDSRVNTYVLTSVQWPYLRVYAVGAGSGARAELSQIRAYFIKPKNQ